jgi:hypothetical protein
VGNRVFHCWHHHGHGPTNMWKGIYQSCDVYFYYFAQKIGMDKIARMMHRMGYGGKFDLPFPTSPIGTVPDPAWKEKKYKKPWAIYDTVNATIGQGYMLVNPLQQAVAASRIASGNIVFPRLMANDPIRAHEPFGVPKEHLDVIRSGMFEVVNGRGSAKEARLPFPNIQMAGKTGTAQVVGLNMNGGNGKIGAGSTATTATSSALPLRQSEICLRRADGAWRQFARRLPGGARHHDLSLRPAEGHGCAGAAGKGLGRHASGTHGRQISQLCRAIWRFGASGRQQRSGGGKRRGRHRRKRPASAADPVRCGQPGARAGW